MVSTENTDSDSFTATYSIKTKPILQFNDESSLYLYEPKSRLYPGNQMVIQTGDEIYTQQSTFFTITSGEIWQTKNGVLQKIASAETGTIGEIQQVAVNQEGDYLVIAGDSVPFTAYVYGSPSDIESNTSKATKSGVYTPEVGSIESYRSQAGGAPVGFLFSEYQSSDGPANVRIIRYSGNDEIFTDVLTVPTTEVRHFHSLDIDPYNNGVFYATTGDTDAMVKWYKSTDFGATWNEITEAGGSQTYRTLNLSFGPDNVYWAMDQRDPCNFYRAPRNDLGNPEKLAATADGYLSYGTCRVWNPNGVLVTTRDNNNAGYETAPMYFYDIDTETFRKIHDHTLNYNTGSKPGVQSILKYQDELTGSVYPEMNGVDQGRTMPSFYGAAFEISKLQ